MHMNHKQNFRNPQRESKQVEGPKRHLMRHRQLVQLAQTRRRVEGWAPSTVVSPAGYNKIHETNPTIKVRTPG